MKVKFIAAILAVCGIAIFSATASASTKGNWNLDHANSAASAIAGHSVAVYCEDSWGEWVDVTRAFGYPSGDGLYGFTFQPGITDPFGNFNAIYLNPQSCYALHVFDYNGWGSNRAVTDAGISVLAYAFIALTHEAQHQAGVTDEGQAQCNAITMLTQGNALTSIYGISPRISTWRYVLKHTKHSVRIVKVRQMVTNPIYTEMLSWINGIHSDDPPEYKTVC